MPDPLFEHRPERMPLERLLPLAGGALARSVGRIVAEHGLSATAMGVLGVLEHRDRLSHREVAAHLGVTPATLTSVVDALEAAGSVSRDRDPDDRRIVRLALTPAGRALLLRAVVQVQDAVRRRFPPPPPEHQEVIRGYLLAVLAAAGRDEVTA